MTQAIQHTAEMLAKAAVSGEPMVVARVVEVEGFSTLPVDEIVAVDGQGQVFGDLLGIPGAEAMAPAARDLIDSDQPRLATVHVTVGGSAVSELGLACGGRVGILLQPASCVPAQTWTASAARAPVALVTVVDGPASGPDALAVYWDGSTAGSLGSAVAEMPGGSGTALADSLVAEAIGMLKEAATARRRVTTEAGTAMIEAWVPSPRLVVVGAGDVVGAIDAQAGLLGWEVRSVPDHEGVDEMLEWAGATAALIVLSHDPHVDVPALAAGLRRPIPYIGAMGSRHTQSRRIERLASSGVGAGDLERIHRPIGLDLGGRRAPEVALAIAAEIQAVLHHRDARSLRDSSGPIHQAG